LTPRNLSISPSLQPPKSKGEETDDPKGHNDKVKGFISRVIGFRFGHPPTTRNFCHCQTRKGEVSGLSTVSRSQNPL
jgi:hypothetical protein